MDIERQRLQDDLRGIVGGDVLCDPLSTQLYASDASIYQISPLAVVRPRSLADVVATVRYAADHELSIHPRGSGSGVSGESLGSGIMIDFSRYMRAVSISPDASRVTVQSGAVLADVNRALASHRRWFGPDPATRSITTFGSVLAVNASGSHYLRSGSARDTIESMKVVLSDGEVVTLHKHSLDDPTPAGRLARGVNEIHDRFADLIKTQDSAPRSRGGFRFDGIVDPSGQVDLAKFMVGTQGTLAVMVEATVRTELIPAHRGVLLFSFYRLDSAARCAVAARRHGVVACDLMDRRLLQIARETETRFETVLPREAEAMLLVEVQGESLNDLTNRMRLLRQDLTSGTDAAFAAVSTVQQEERDMFWALSRRVIPRLYRVKGSQAPLPFVEDIAVPPDRLPELLTAIQDILKKNQTTAIFFSHAGHGQLHVRPFLDLGNVSDRARLRRISEEIAEVVWEHEGQVNVEHAAGLSRSFLLPRQFGDLWQAMGQVKRLFDPFHRLNPGKLFGAILQKPDENLRPANQTIEIASGLRVVSEADEETQQRSQATGQPVPRLTVLQNWPAGAGVSQVTRACNGCGRCRTTAPRERQCPMFRASPREEATPRAKANLLRGVLSGQIPVSDLADDRAKAIADLCFNCHQCRVDCPASVNIPKVVGELKAQYVATNGQSFSDLLLGRLDIVAAIANQAVWVSNPLMRNRMARWIIERLFGITAARELPPVVRETFLRYASRRRWTRATRQGGLKVVYFVDHYANYHDPDIGRALAEILQQNQIAIYVPPNQYVSGMARITAGDLRGARRLARKNTRLLADAVRQGYTVLATEPSAVLCLKHEYMNLLDDEDANLVAQNSYDACEFLWKLHNENRLTLDFAPVSGSVAYHQPCHLRVNDPARITPKLLDLIPGLRVESIEAGCTGMAGTWGLQRKNYRSSLRIGWPLISAMRHSDSATATTECSACKMQIEHASARPTVHPLKLLAYAYGRMPKFEKEFGTLG